MDYTELIGGTFETKDYGKVTIQGRIKHNRHYLIMRQNTTSEWSEEMMDEQIVLQENRKEESKVIE